MTADAAGGVWQYACDLSRALCDSDAEVLLVTWGPAPSPDQLQACSGIPTLRTVHLNAALEWMPGGLEDLPSLTRSLLHLENEFHPDVVHLNSYSPAAAPWRSPVVTVAHSCVTSWWHAVHRCDPPEEWRAYRECVRQGLEHSSEIVAPSRAMQQALATHYGIGCDRSVVIHNFSQAAPAERAKQPFLLAAGRMWDAAKNLGLLRAVSPHVPWPIRIAGSENEANDGLTHLGRLPHDSLLEQMAAATIFVHPTLYEPFGLAVLEAARAGCCLLLADIPSLRELWQDAAVFLDPRQPQAWAQAIHGLVLNPSELRRLSEAARASSERFQSTTTSRLYHEVYERATAAKAKSGSVAA